MWRLTSVLSPLAISLQPHASLGGKEKPRLWAGLLVLSQLKTRSQHRPFCRAGKTAARADIE